MCIAVVIPLFNGAPWIEETLRSVQSQTLPPDEIVVVDDGSTDGGPEVVAGVPGARLLRSPSRGSTSARRHGADAVVGTFIAHVDQDDVWHPNHLVRLREVLENDRDLGAVAARTVRFRDGGRPALGAGSGAVSPLDPWATFPARCPIRAPSAVLFRRTTHDAAGGFAADLAGIGDLVLYLTACLEHPFASLDLATTGVREQPGSQTRALRADGVAYLGLHARGTGRALKARIRKEGSTSEVPRFALRQRALESLVELVRAVRAGDEAGAARHATDLESCIADVRELDDLWSLVTRCMIPDTEKRERRRLRFELLERLDRACPATAPRVRRSLVVYASRKSWPVGALTGSGRGFALRVLARRLRRL